MLLDPRWHLASGRRITLAYLDRVFGPHGRTTALEVFAVREMRAVVAALALDRSETAPMPTVGGGEALPLPR